MVRPARKEIQPFIALNAEEKRTNTHLSWKDRYALIIEAFPSSVRLEWAEAFRDIDLYGRLIKDILRIDQVYDHRNGPGPRPVLDKDRARERFRQLMGEDFSCEPFTVAFPSLAGTRSVRHLATKIGMGRHLTHDLILGKKVPDLWTIEQIAEAFGKHPSYFIEYRNAYILRALGDQLELSPETSVDLYKQLRTRANASISDRRPKRRRESVMGNHQ